ncbi:CG4757 [Drosophila busckii]|uniref:Carboxylic ester hydrolase n=1 Tax=Drosophila busckii TaxID=30019 RepID=A0A0M4ED55_DROBS|nr:CG4757 [Drosophila busckii]
MLKLILCACVLLAAATICWSIEVQTELGTIRGVSQTSRLGAEFYAFRGIRYAEPPVDKLRFKNPEPVKAWTPKIFDASEDGPMCPQPWDNTTVVSEDCLRLNVYTKQLHTSSLLPVIVFLHPGGFYAFSGQSKFLAGAEHLMDRNCVLVSLNYRLGSLGFLATGTKDAPGNAGLKDQVLALRWIQQHIQHFGGDPKSVTLLGYSAGSLSIGLHMLSPMSRGLFHRGICMSASPYGQWTYESEQLTLAQRQARLLKCPETPVKEMVRCMRRKNMQSYVSTYTGMFEFGWDPVLNWMPVIEPDFGQERFLLEHPYKTAQSGNFYKVPLIAGITEFEFLSGAFFALRNDSIREQMNANWQHMAPIMLLYERNSTHSREASAVLRQKYLDNKRLEFPDSWQALGRVYSDALIGVEFHRFLRLMAAHTPIYTYYFRYKGRYSFFMHPDTNQTVGAVHHDELLYLFHVKLLTPLFKPSDPEHLLIERMTRMWVQFASNGNPHNSTDEYLRELSWPLHTASKPSYLQIDENLTSKSGHINAERYQIWDELFPLPTF